MYIQASLMFICSLNVCTCGAMSATLLLWRTEGGCYCCFCYSVIPGRDQESYIWICTVFSLTLCCRWDEIPGPGQGWRCRGHLCKVGFARWNVKLASLGKTQACLLGKRFASFLKQKNIKTKGGIECSNLRSSGLDVLLLFQCCAPLVLGFQSFCSWRTEGLMILHMLLSCHSWLGPGILW